MTYFGSVDWYRQIACAKEDVIYIEAHEYYVKQTERNRCTIATANGKQNLSVPVTAPPQPSPFGEGDMLPYKPLIKDILISDHGNWRHNHWEALKSAYGMSPFFDFYKDDIHPFFEVPHITHQLPPCGGGRGERLLFDFNMAIATKMLELIGINKTLLPTDSYQGKQTSPLARQKDALPSVQRTGGLGRPYYQTFQRRHGFIPHLSILDLLFNEGPEAILKLRT